MITPELIRKFFSNECNASEKEMMIQYLNDHPEELENFLTEEEWEKFEFSEKLHPAFSRKLFEKTEKETYKKTYALRQWKRLAVAASVLLMVILGLKFFMNVKGETNDQLAITDKTGNDQSGFELRFNTTDENIMISLPDSSTVELTPKSGIRYHQSFVHNNKRLVYLSGKALFHVAKDKTKPFTVFSGDISTTALGTSFVINAFDDNETISVKLLTGKVVVKSADSVHKKLAEDKYLKPGDELIYNKRSMLASLRQAKEINTSEARINSGNGTITETPNWYMFNNQTLPQVFAQLEELYSVQIHFSPAEVKNMYFIGRFEKSDSLEDILNDIALLNHLSVKKQQNGYSIRLKK